MPTWGYRISEIAWITEVLTFPLLFQGVSRVNGFFIGASLSEPHMIGTMTKIACTHVCMYMYVCVCVCVQGCTQEMHMGVSDYIRTQSAWQKIKTTPMVIRNSAHIGG